MHLNRSGAIFLNIIDLTGVGGQEYTFGLFSTIYPRGFKKKRFKEDGFTNGNYGYININGFDLGFEMSIT